MKRLPILGSLAVGLAVAYSGCMLLPADRQAKSPHPNIIVILADDLGYGDVGAYNPDSRIPTPNLDRLAAEGLCFSDAHCPASVCTPSRYALLTGRYAWRTRLKKGVLGPWDPPLIEPGRPTVATMLRDQGYQTACIGKWHLGWNWPTLDGAPANAGVAYGETELKRRHALGANIDYTQSIAGGPLDSGFDTYFGDDVPNFPPYTWIEQDRVITPPTLEKPEEMFGRPGAMAPGWKLEDVMPQIVENAIQTIAENDGTPFFLYFALTAPHEPVVPHGSFYGRSGAGAYGDYVCEVDWAVGLIMATLEWKGFQNNTLLIFTSDNGPERNAYERIREFGHASMGPWRGIKRDLWEGGHRVPFIARWPGVTPAGSQCDALISLQDLFATCAEIVKAPIPPNTAEDSVSLVSLLQGGNQPVRDSVVHHSASGRFAIREGNWVLIDAPSGDDNGEPEWFQRRGGYAPHSEPGELFDLASDPGECTNLFARRPDIVKRLSALLERVKAGQPDPPGSTSQTTL